MAKKNKNNGRVTANKEKTQKQPTDASTWKKSRRAGQPFDLTVPSGNVCRCKAAPGMAAFYERGMVPNALMPLVRVALEGETDGDDMEKAAKEVLHDAERIGDVVTMVNEVCLDVVLIPKLAPQPRDENGQIIPVNDPRRDEETLYVDDVDIEDRMFIFSVAVGGTTDLERFRHEQAAPLDPVPSEPGVGQEAQ